MTQERAASSSSSAGNEVEGTHLAFGEIPPHALSRLLIRQAGAGSDQITINLRPRTGLILLAVLGGAWLFGLVALANGYLWPSTTQAWYAASTLAAAVALWWAGERLLALQRAPLKSRIYLTPIYFIRVDHSGVSFWPLWLARDAKATHNHRNGVYANTTFTLRFADGVQSFSVGGKDWAEAIWKQVRAWGATFRAAYEKRDEDWFLAQDDFAGIGGLGRRRLTRAERIFGIRRASELPRYLIALAAGIIWISGATSLNAYFDDKHAWDDAAAFNRASSFRKYLDEHPRGRWRAAADARLGGAYDDASRRYEASGGARGEAEAAAAVVNMLRYARQSGDYRVHVAFLRRNRIPSGIERELAVKFGAANVLPMGDAFSEQNMMNREVKIVAAVKSAFQTVIPEDVLDFQAGEAAAGQTQFLVEYAIQTGDCLYYNVNEELLSQTSRHYYPGIRIDWLFRVDPIGGGQEYSFRLDSNPAEHISGSGDVYDIMAESAFEDFQRAVVAKFGLVQGGGAP